MTVPLLAIDTSGARLQLGLMRQSDVLTAIEARERGHAEILFGRIAGLLAEAGQTYADLRRIAVVTGPGSFSGLRIGLSAARGLALALSIPVIGVPRLLGLSLTAGGPGPIGVLVDAHRGEAYCETFTAPGQGGSGTALMPHEAARAAISGCAIRIESEFGDIAAIARFAATADPAAFPSLPAYIRAADAKPQEKGRIARVGAGP
ncbi:MAG: tRNA (adenosine(37)-N6)-threonylcarbamoyltransferase complex dimerization subunit type 1 TsaB [Alphaproteobacteria bacterium]|nr:tRNA (adenosine(37)-N6)-threonylcarbamoyltransferase complex dimerization subunit type 1 TsaB [Alphaproteobacteria bacterium]